jgi:Immunity protein 35
MSINLETATILVLQHINKVYGKSNDNDIERELSIVEITSKDDGWIFYYDTKASKESGDWRDSLIGSPPIFVFKDNGKMYSIYSDTDEEEIIRRHREKYPLPSQDYSFTDINTKSPHPLLA